MTLQEARALRDEIRAAGIDATVPTGYGPNKYFVRIENRNLCFYGRSSWEMYQKDKAIYNFWKDKENVRAD